MANRKKSQDRPEVAVLTLMVWVGGLAWLGWRGLVLAFVATFVEWVLEVRSVRSG